MIQVRGLSKYFGRFSALRNLDLAIGQGEFIALFGRNGAGKSTLLRLLAGLSRASSGSIEYSSRLVASLWKLNQRGAIGYLSHLTSLYLDLTAIENLRFYAQLIGLGLNDEDLVRRIGGVGLAGWEREPVRNYSRGMQQRLAIARAFLHDPDILLLDEPFTGLDQSGSDLLKRFLLEAHAGGKTCIMAIHDPQIGYELADRLVILDRGSAVFDAKKSTLSFEKFRERYLKSAADHADI
jgi:heme exporter protein A